MSAICQKFISEGKAEHKAFLPTNFNISWYSVRASVCNCLVVDKGTYTQSFLYLISSSVLLVPNQTCTETVKICQNFMIRIVLFLGKEHLQILFCIRFCK